MPPFIGQGLNSGFRDAAALAWRLPLLLSGLAKPEFLLQSYQSERMDHVRKITVGFNRMISLMIDTYPPLCLLAGTLYPPWRSYLRNGLREIEEDASRFARLPWAYSLCRLTH